MTTPFGRPGIGAKIDLSTFAGCGCRRSQRHSFRSPDSQALRLRPTEYPVMTLEEQIAEKLARYRRTSLARDLYDLAWCAGR
ncbi:MAG: nucleotidyl transferase AbiEii/AbiGii toxin family protein, partial [Candidatus Microthrix sp.]|nr:nucleotidyl transferase AbiEii/AbiGii toxin family protein [Candidatus Microthrix sp.]